jgi:hypothetical protein
LQANTRLRERLQALNVQDDKKLVIGAESNALEEIRREKAPNNKPAPNLLFFFGGGGGGGFFTWS